MLCTRLTNAYIRSRIGDIEVVATFVDGRDVGEGHKL